MKDNTMGVRLKLLREEERLSMQELAEALNRSYDVNVNRGMISKWENGVDVMKLKHLRAYVSFFDESADFIIGLSNVRKKPPGTGASTSSAN